jgi:alkylmercury lyase
MRVQPNREELAQAHLDVFTADQARLLLHSVRLLAKGAPVSLEQLAEASHLAREQVQELFQASSIELNREGNLPALALSLQPTPHQFHLGEKSLYTGCALDALIVPTLLGRSARVTSSCPVTGTQIHLTVTPEALSHLEPTSTFVSLVAPGVLEESICDYGRFFASQEAASTWPSLHPKAVLLSVEDAASLGRQIARGLLARA